MIIDMIGQTFNNLTVIGRQKNDIHGRAVWVCKCACNNEDLWGINNGITLCKDCHTELHKGNINYENII